MVQIQDWLAQIGEAFAGLWIAVFGIIVLFAFPVSAIAACFFLGFYAAQLVGFGSLGGVVWISVAFLFGLFLSIYVWKPHVKPLVLRFGENIADRK